MFALLQASPGFFPTHFVSVIVLAKIDKPVSVSGVCRSARNLAASRVTPAGIKKWYFAALSKVWSG